MSRRFMAWQVVRRWAAASLGVGSTAVRVYLAEIKARELRAWLPIKAARSTINILGNRISSYRRPDEVGDSSCNGVKMLDLGTFV